MLTPTRLYMLIGLMAAASYGLLAWLFMHTGSGGVEICHIKRITDVPCPSCGTSRSLLLLLEGRVFASMMMNPLGLVAAFLLAVLPGWAAIDLIRGSRSLYEQFREMEALLKNRLWLSGLLILVIAANWAWNIMKMT